MKLPKTSRLFQLPKSHHRFGRVYSQLGRLQACLTGYEQPLPLLNQFLTRRLIAHYASSYSNAHVNLSLLLRLAARPV